MVSAADQCFLPRSPRCPGPERCPAGLMQTTSAIPWASMVIVKVVPPRPATFPVHSTCVPMSVQVGALRPPVRKCPLCANAGAAVMTSRAIAASITVARLMPVPFCWETNPPFVSGSSNTGRGVDDPSSRRCPGVGDPGTTGSSDVRCHDVWGRQMPSMISSSSNDGSTSISSRRRSDSSPYRRCASARFPSIPRTRMTTR